MKGYELPSQILLQQKMQFVKFDKQGHAQEFTPSMAAGYMKIFSSFAPDKKTIITIVFLLDFVL